MIHCNLNVVNTVMLFGVRRENRCSAGFHDGIGKDRVEVLEHGDSGISRGLEGAKLVYYAVIWG